MKTFNTLAKLSLAASVLMMIGCTNDDTAELTPDTTNEIKVAEGFSFETVETVTVKITAPDFNSNPIDGAVFKVYTDDPENGGELLTQGTSNSEGVFETKLSLATYSESVFVTTNHSSIYYKTVEVPIVSGEATHTYSYPDENDIPQTRNGNESPSDGSGGSTEISQATFSKTTNSVAGTDTITLFFEDFEGGIGGWTTQVYTGNDDLWHIVTKNPGPEGGATNAMWCGVNSSGNYNTGNRINTAVVSPQISLPNDDGLVLIFDEKYKTEPWWDYCMVSVSTDGGNNWTELRGKPKVKTISGLAPSGNSGGWINTELSLEDFAGQTIQLRFYFDTIDGIAQNFSGWFVDNVEVIQPDADTDGDGVSDKVDDYPNDATKAFNLFYPDNGNFGSLVFEDRWPNQGDFDFNDLAIDFKYQGITNAANELVEVKATYVVKAVGATLKNGFGVEMNIPQAKVTNFTRSQPLTESFINTGSNGLEVGHPSDKTVVIVYDNVSNIMQPPNGSIFVNTESGVAYVDPDTTEISFALNPPLTSLELDELQPPFNPFMFVDRDRSHEIHLPDKEPTALADLSLLGTSDDDSDEATGKYYKTANDLPWAISMPNSFDYPKEKVDILNAYYNFDDWAQSGGTNNTDWYLPILGNINLLNIFQISGLLKE